MGAEQTTGSEGAPGKAESDKPVKEPFTFTHDGCRWEVRLGALLILVAVFVWLWQGPTISSNIYMVGMPFLLIGVVLQALDGRKLGRPGYPLRLGLVLAIGGALMWPDLMYREEVGGSAHTQPMAPMLLIPGVWILLWWPVSRLGQAQVSGSQGGVPA